VHGTVVTHNIATYGGGLFVVETGWLGLTDSTVTYNTATGRGLGAGGGIVNSGGTVSITNTVVNKDHPDNYVDW